MGHLEGFLELKQLVGTLGEMQAFYINDGPNVIVKILIKVFIKVEKKLATAVSFA